MVYIIFNTRNPLFSFAKKLSSAGISHSIVNTPKHMGRSCSLAIKMTASEYQKAKPLVSSAMGDIYAVKRG